MANRELKEAIKFYENKQKGLGRALRKEAYLRIDTLKIFPHRAAHIFGAFRRLLIDRFPYGIIYSIDGNLLYIIAIAHLSRAPDFWHDRVELGE